VHGNFVAKLTIQQNYEEFNDNIMPTSNIALQNVYCRKVKFGEQSKSGLYETVFDLGMQSNAYDKLLCILKEKYGEMEYVDGDNDISEMGETLWTEADVAKVSVPGGVISLENALERGSLFTCHVDVFLRDVSVNIKEVSGKTVGEVTIGGVRVKVNSNLTFYAK
jgi:hypothetical protein